MNRREGEQQKRFSIGRLEPFGPGQTRLVPVPKAIRYRAISAKHASLISAKLEEKLGRANEDRLPDSN